MTLPLRIGVVGVGALGRHHVRLLAEIPEAELVGLCDENPNVALEFSQTYGVPAFDDYLHLASQVEAMVLAVPTLLHAEMGVELLQRGLHVMVEKPICATLAESDRLLAAADDRILAVGHVEFFNPAVQALLRDPADPGFVVVERLSPFTRRSLDIDVVLDLMIHDLQILQALDPTPIVEVRAVGVKVLSGKIDLANARLEFESGCVANVTASRVSADKVRALRAFMSDRYYSLDYQKQSLHGYRLAEGSDDDDPTRRIRPVPVEIVQRSLSGRTSRISSPPVGATRFPMSTAAVRAKPWPWPCASSSRSTDRTLPEELALTNPRIGVIGGTGLYSMSGLEVLEEKVVETPFGDPSDAVIVGRYGEHEVLFLPRHGRGHRLLPTEVNYRANLWALKSLGITHQLSVSAVGSMQEQYRPKDVVLPDQFFDRTRQRPGTFFGNGLVAHVSLADPVCARPAGPGRGGLEDAVAPVAIATAPTCAWRDPQFSTRAESSIYRQWGVDVIGMTNLQEAKLAREAELCFVCLALVTDYDCWKSDEDDVSGESVMAVLAENVSPRRRPWPN